MKMWQWKLFLRTWVALFFCSFHWRFVATTDMYNVLISMCLCLQSCEFIRGKQKILHILQIEWSIIRNAEINRTHIIPNYQWCVEVSFISTIETPKRMLTFFYGPTNNTRNYTFQLLQHEKLVIIWQWDCYWESSTLIFTNKFPWHFLNGQTKDKKVLPFFLILCAYLLITQSVMTETPKSPAIISIKTT